MLSRHSLACFLAFAAIVGFAGGSHVCFAGEHKKNAHESPQGKISRRTLLFPSTFSLGNLVFVPADFVNGPGTATQTSTISQARGKVVVDVPNTMAVALLLSNQVLAKPECLNSVNGAGIDALKLAFYAEDEKERHYCDQTLQYLPRFKDLQCLDLDHSDSTDAGLSKIGALKNLRSITGFMTGVRGDCFKDLRTLPLLARVDFEQCAIAEENLRYLSEFPSLRRLGLAHVELTDRGLGYVCKCQSLTSLRIQENSKITERGLRQLLVLKNLRNLDLRKTAVTLSSIAQLKSMHLDSLWLSDKFLTPNYKSRIQAMFPHTELSVMEVSDERKDDEVIFSKLH